MTDTEHVFLIILAITILIIIFLCVLFYCDKGDTQIDSDFKNFCASHGYEAISAWREPFSFCAEFLPNDEVKYHKVHYLNGKFVFVR